ncbi:MAG: hypothetical protein NTV51_24420 [Verrucomicrobia bacterium]|nr:hypothetical protein [Verrucomicrobiota bacterium]
MGRAVADRQAHSETGAAAGRALERDLASLVFDEAGDDGEAEARAGGLGGEERAMSTGAATVAAMVSSTCAEGRVGRTNASNSRNHVESSTAPSAASVGRA